MKVKTTNKTPTPVFAILALILFSATILKAGPGDLDPTFSGDGKLTDGLSRGEDSARGVAIQPDGKIVVAGTSWTGLSYDFAVARYNIDGSLDSTFGAGGKVTTDFDNGDDGANSIAIQPDGKIVAAGTTSNFDFGVVRYNPDGSLDSTFGTGGKVTADFNQSYDVANSVAIQADGKIVAAGVKGYDGSDFALARYNSNGSLDISFGSGGKVTTDFNNQNQAAYSVAVHTDGKIVAAGWTNTNDPPWGFHSDFAIARYYTDGSLDTTFDGDGKVTSQNGFRNSYAYAVAIQPDGKIVAAGIESGLDNFTAFSVVRFNTDGSFNGKAFTNPLPPGFIGFAGARSVAIQPDGKIVAAGHNGSAVAVLRVNADLSHDSTFGNNGNVITPIGSNAEANAVAIQSDGKIVVAGTANSDLALVSYDPNGSLDTSFDGDGKVTTDFGFFRGNSLHDTAIQPDGKIVGVGEVLGDFAVVRYTSDGSPDTTFGGTGKVTTDIETDTGRTVAIQTDGKIIVAGGSHGFWDGEPTPGSFALARYNADGSLDPTFDGDGTVITHVSASGSDAYDVVIQPDGKIVAAGSSDNNFAVVRYNPDGSLDTSFDGDGIVTTPIGSSARINSVKIQQDGKIVATGPSFDGSFTYFTTARYNTNGSLDPTFDGDGIVTTLTSKQDEVYSSVLQPDGKIVVAGSRLSFANDYDPTSFALIRYNPNGSLDTTFGGGGLVTTNVGVHSGVRSVALQSDGKIVAAGSSDSDFAIVRYNPNGSPDTTFGGGDGIKTVDFDNSNDSPYGMALDNVGRAVVVGESEGRFAMARFLLAPRRAIADFDGDGRSDISVFRPSDRVWYLDQSTAGFSAMQFGLATDKITPADYDGDGKTDISVYRDGTWYWLKSSNGSFNAAQFGLAGDVPVPADFTGDGRAELAVYRGGTWWTYDLVTNQAQAIQFGLPSDKPVVADYDGDGRADQAVYRGDGQWHLNRSSLAYTVVQFGLVPDKPVVADYDGDGKADLAVYRDGTWYLQQSTAGFTAFQFGIATDTPAPADYDGDGKTDAAVYRNGVWYQLGSTGGISIQQFGLAGDKPAAAAYVP